MFFTVVHISRDFYRLLLNAFIFNEGNSNEIAVICCIQANGTFKLTFLTNRRRGKVERRALMRSVQAKFPSSCRHDLVNNRPSMKTAFAYNKSTSLRYYTTGC